MTDEIDLSALREHPAARIFPMMSDRELEVLANDIREKGLLEPITLCKEGGEVYVLDGRNRVHACAVTGTKPRWAFRDESDPAAYVLSKNLHRRHLTDSQRAMVAAKMARLRSGQNARFQATASAVAVTQSEAAKALNVSVDSVQRARKVIDSGSAALIEEVEAGRVSVNAAAESSTRVARAEPEEPSSSRRVDHKGRESEVRRLHGEGLGTLEIARSLNLEPSTVSSVKGRLGVANTGSVKLWRDVEHLVNSLVGGAPLVEGLANRLGTEKVKASPEEVQSCIKKLSKVTASIRALAAALKENSTCRQSP